CLGGTGAKIRGVAVDARAPAVGTYPGVLVEIMQPRDDEAFRGLQRAVHRPIIGLPTNVIRSSSQTTTPSRMSTCVCPLKPTTVPPWSCVRMSIPPFYCPVWFMLSWRCKVGNVQDQAEERCKNDREYR